MKRLVTFFAFLASVTFSTLPIFAQSSGSLDPSYDGDGISVVPVSAAAATAGVMQPDGKALALFSATGGVVEIVRFNPDGGADLSFGGGDGVASHPWVGASGRNGNANAIALQNGKIIVAGWTYVAVRRSTAIALRVDRYLSDGSPDASFGTGGTFVYQTGYASGVAVQPDGKILTTGAEPMSLVRLLSDGGLDSSFGSGGIVNITNIVGGKAVAVQSDGKIVVAGTQTLSGKGSKPRMTVARFLANGAADATFGTSGRTTVDFSGAESQGRNVLIDPNGSIVVGGRTGTLSNGDIAIARLLSNGVLDSSFNFDGKATYDFAGKNDDQYGLARQSDGKILAGGTSGVSTTTTFSLVRFDSAGNLDMAFGSGGGVTTDVFGLGDSWGRTILIQPDTGAGEKVIMTGLARSGSAPFWHAAAVRYFE